jgi:hypothetical protein
MPPLVLALVLVPELEVWVLVDDVPEEPDAGGTPPLFIAANAAAAAASASAAFFLAAESDEALLFAVLAHDKIISPMLTIKTIFFIKTP